MMKYAYAWEKLHLTVTTLAASDAPLQERLADAWSFHGHRLDGLTPDLPKDLLEDFSAIHATLTRVEDREQGAIRATCAAMAREEAAEVVKRIVSLYDSVCRAHYGGGG